MTRMRRTRSALLSAMLASGCAHASARMSATAFRRETDAPLTPPAVTLESDDARFRGTLYTADWPALHASTRPASTPVPWPSAPTVEAKGFIAVELHTTSEPDQIVVAQYRAVGHDGQPTEHAARTDECERFTATPCALAHVGATIRARSVPRVHDAVYVVAFVRWHLPVSQRRHPTDADATESWLFVVGRPRQAGDA